MDGLRSEAQGATRVTGLTQLMRARTAGLHAEAEQSGIIASIRSGTVTRPDYALYLRNLLPAYQQMERGLRQHSVRPGFELLSRRSLHRASRILADLKELSGADWPDALPLLPAGESYAYRMRFAARRGGLLLAHAYTRYLGDLSGGQILRLSLLRRFGADFRATAFTEFPAIPAIGDYVNCLRAALDEAGRSMAHPDPIPEEAAVAFQLNIQVSKDVAAFRLERSPRPHGDRRR